MKKIFLGVVCLVAVLSVQGLARAQSACGGTVVHSSDCDNNGREYSIACCPDGYKALGVAYSDIHKQDHVDAVTVVCQSANGGQLMVPTDAHNPQQFNCDPSEKLVGIYAKDVRTDAGGDRDSLDGVTAICQNTTSHSTRRVHNNDIEGGREGVEVMAPAGHVIVGIAYKDQDKGTSDRADCATIVTKPEAAKSSVTKKKKK